MGPRTLRLAGWKSDPSHGTQGPTFSEPGIESRDPVLGRHVVFLADYELTVARSPLHAVDVWLNTPLMGWAVVEGEEYADPAYQD